MDGLFHGKSYYEWMMTGGTTIYGNPHIAIPIICLGHCTKHHKTDHSLKAKYGECNHGHLCNNTTICLETL